MHHDRAVEHPGPVHQRRPDHQHRRQLGGARDELLQGVDHTVEQGVLQEQVVDRVAAE